MATRTTKAPKSNAPTPNDKKRNWIHLLGVLCVLGGVAIMAYPVIATLIINYSQMQASEKVREATIHEFNDDQRKKLIEDAHEYNKQLVSGPILDPFLQRVAPNTKLYRDYLKYLNFDGIIGSVDIPEINVNLPIYHGTFDDALNRGAGHLFGSALPIGGNNTHSIITAHSGLGSATMFDNLPKLKVGDPIYLHVGGQTLKYDVRNTETVLPTNTKSLNMEPGKDLVTLITCTPYGINTHRLLVHAERAPLDPKEEEKVNSQPVYQIWQNWMILPIVISVFLLSLLFIPPKKKRKKDDEQPKPPVAPPNSLALPDAAPEATANAQAGSTTGASAPVDQPENATQNALSSPRAENTEGENQQPSETETATSEQAPNRKSVLGKESQEVGAPNNDEKAPVSDEQTSHAPEQAAETPKRKYPSRRELRAQRGNGQN
ncbi:hypothetical protein BK816_01415 [Boudabousia tangfeifanii]|uniref:Class C sortase n=1 Tax=Boudabousia tangfeifanii TaxID=1912795 RepID=A0A1D9MIL3_9ACTO|nr:class C sortase [Boudabousia tangfeifanii]AOZ72116.1 hypothetical protein BK816_01415 [Boudabousia tangfeifanii]